MFIQKLTEKDVRTFIKLLKYDDENLEFSHFIFNDIKFTDGGVYVKYAPLIDNFNVGEVELFISDFNIAGSLDFIYETKAKKVLKEFMSGKFGDEYKVAYNNQKNELSK